MATTLEADVTLDRELLLRLYREMVNIRKSEEQLARSYAQGNIPGACHTYIGQEAVAVGVCAHLRAEDVVFSTHRGHGHALAKGVSPRELIAELFGKATGVSRGRGGSMHLFSPEVGLLGTTGIVGPNILQATGAGYAFKMLKTDKVSVGFFGDGAMNNGAFHEGVNMAAIWDLPVVYVCENNMYATEVPFEYSTKNQNVAERARTYGIDAVAVDGNDVIAIWEAARASVERARVGSGPSLIEART
ncbi:MAG: thiamine pyrophosphate-dependent dehydrogenase E1 component subunit alpha, partial [Thermomicrobiales bacterium]